MITIDQLRALGSRPHYMGLGVIKYPFRHNRAYHFWSDRAKPLVEDIHDHRFSFTSKVVKGILKNYIYTIDGTDPNSTLQLESGSCVADAERNIIHPNLNLREDCTFTTTVDEEYYIHYQTLHRVELITTKVVTLLTKELPFKQDEPHFVTDTANPSACAFSKPISEAECWEIIEYTLSDK